MTTTTEATVRREVTVAAPVERAFDVFTAGLSSWWPLETHHIGAQPAVEAVMEPRTGGRYFERAADGSECDWGFVLAWEPPTRVVFSWHLNERWEFDPDPERASEVEVRFTPEGDSTRVELEHRGLERHGAGAETIREAVSSEGGWGGLLELYKRASEAR
jgi:uncharacterized protein YndB with AHSA1/START domain